MDWMLYDFAKDQPVEAIRHRIVWYERQAKSWMQTYVDAKNELASAQSKLEVAERQMHSYARCIKELSEYATQFNKAIAA